MTLDFSISVMPPLIALQQRFKNDDPALYDVLTDRGNYEGPMFAVSWFLTFFSHDIENFSNIQRLFDVIISSEPDLIKDVIQETILHNKQALYDYVTETEDISTATFVIFRTPIRSLNNPETMEKIIQAAISNNKTPEI
jgi:hypothetical protein